MSVLVILSISFMFGLGASVGGFIGWQAMVWLEDKLTPEK